MTRPILPSSTEEEITELMPLEITWDELREVLDGWPERDNIGPRTCVYHYRHDIDKLLYSWHTIGLKLNGIYYFREDIGECHAGYLSAKRWTGMTRRQIDAGMANGTIGRIV